MRYLLLVNHEKNGYFPQIQNSDACIEIYYKSEIKIHRFLRKIILKSQSRLIDVLFSHWLKIAEKSENIILFDTKNIVEICRYLIKKYPNKRIIVWYWNSVSDSIPPTQLKNIKNLEIWSFDPQDCQKYEFFNNTQFYFTEHLQRKGNISIPNTKAFYVGADKNRSKVLKELREYFEDNNISYNFHLVKFKDNIKQKDFEYKQPLSYPDVIECIRNSEVLIDLVAEWQTGLTLRPLEAIFFKKKLITNMKNITSYDFYNKNNVFILGVDNMNDLFKFISSKYDDADNYIYTKEYSFNEWINRFHSRKILK